MYIESSAFCVGFFFVLWEIDTQDSLLIVIHGIEKYIFWEQIMEKDKKRTKAFTL